MDKRVVIIGAGPTGLGAAYRLKELGHNNFVVYERDSQVGGLSASVQKNGYTMDFGGHVLFSHYPYFDQVVEKALNGQYLEHQREAWVWIMNRFVPYPFQNNIKYLPKEIIWECVDGLFNLPDKETNNFEEWIESVFGSGIAKYFMNPYNFKVWAHPLDMMSKDWIAERFSVIYLKRVIKNIILDRSDAGWGPNATFHFPLYGGTGGIFTNIAESVKEYISFEQNVVHCDTSTREIVTNNDNREQYDILINTSPLDQFIIHSDLNKDYGESTKDLLHSGGYSVCVAFDHPIDERLRTKCWNYFPESSTPFYRVTYISNYSPNMVPDIQEQYMVMCETSCSEYKIENHDEILDRTIEGLFQSGFTPQEDRKDICFTDVRFKDYSYPVPTVNRDRALNTILPVLEERNIFSRGRFGLWKYEVGNMDHSFMQGVEIIDRLFQDKPEDTIYRK